MHVISPKKLIEVALPLDAINEAAAREKSIRHGHPSTLHLWWARRPLAAARAVIYGQLVHDPEDLWKCQNPGKEPNSQIRGHWTRARNEHFRLIEELVKWENTTNEKVLGEARAAIRESWRQTCELNRSHPDAANLFNPDKMPGLHDPFAGGGAIPLEAQRLGLDAYASDLNPVAVLINKAMIEIPPRFAGRGPVNPKDREEQGTVPREWKGAAGLAADVRYYGQWMRAEAAKRIGHLYPPVRAVRESDGTHRHATSAELANPKGKVEELTVIAWLWARTVKSPNPAFSHVDVPLASTFVLSSKAGKEAYVEPVIEKDTYRFTVKVGTPPPEAENGTKLARGANFRCLISQTTIPPKYIYEQGLASKIGTKLMAIVAEGTKGRVYLSPIEEHSAAAATAHPTWLPDLKMPENPRWFSPPAYGLTRYGDLFTPRQLVALTTFSDLVSEVRERIINDAKHGVINDDDASLDSQGSGTRAYAEAVSVYLAFALSKIANIGSSIASWMNDRGAFRETFARQAIPMTWDFAEANSFADAGGSFAAAIDKGAMALEAMPANTGAHVVQSNASEQEISIDRFVSTDPPYYDNIGYADLSDFFYVWLRPAMRSLFPRLFATISVPKAEELVASPYRHGGKPEAELFFINGMTEAMRRLSNQANRSAPITIYYAFKQSDTDTSDDTSSTGWGTFLMAVHRAGLQLTGTWPMRTEGAGRLIAKGNNALASSIVLVCRPRQTDAGTISRRQFVRLLNEALPPALEAMTRRDAGDHSPVAPVDLSQAIIGPGMAIFSRYDAVLEADGTPMSVKTALQLINRFLAEDDFDPDTQFCLHWFEESGWNAGPFGKADTLARAKGTSVEGVKSSGVIAAGGGSVRLLRWRELPENWDPSADARLPVWEVLHQLIRGFNSAGDAGAAKILAATAGKAEAARQLAYRLYTLCERQGWAEDARAYNEVVKGWSGIETRAAENLQPSSTPQRQQELF
ncbi:MAG: DUF1156 domain-containing protein [Opitutaceae bacterium]